MKLRDLEALSAVFQTSTVSGAARMLGVTQSAVSRMLARLETDMGFALFHRQGGRLIPTRGAQTVRPEVERLVEDISNLRQLCANVSKGRAGELKVGCPQGLILDLLPEAVRLLSDD